MIRITLFYMYGICDKLNALVPDGSFLSSENPTISYAFRGVLLARLPMATKGLLRCQDSFNSRPWAVRLSLTIALHAIFLSSSLSSPFPMMRPSSSLFIIAPGTSIGKRDDFQIGSRGDDLCCWSSIAMKKVKTTMIKAVGKDNHAQCTDTQVFCS